MAVAVSKDGRKVELTPELAAMAKPFLRPIGSLGALNEEEAREARIKFIAALDAAAVRSA